MELQEYLSKRKDFLAQLLEYFDDESHEKSDITFFRNYYRDEKIKEIPGEFETLLRLLLNISRNHYRHLDFYEKLDQILDYIKSDIKELFSNNELYLFFIKQKRILLFFLRQKILTIDQFVVQKFIEDLNEAIYFWPEFKEFIEEEQRVNPNSSIIKNLESEIQDVLEYENDNEEEDKNNKKINDNFNLIDQLQNLLLDYDPNFLKDFEEKRRLGENSSHIAYLIRNDLIDEFIIYINKNSVNLSECKIKDSFFETNSILLNGEANLIEYASFFGSIQIFKYLRNHGVLMNKTRIRKFAIHGNNAEIIQVVEDAFFPNKEIPENNDGIDLAFYFSVKFFNNDIAEYYQNFLKSIQIDSVLENINYNFFPTDFFQLSTLHLLCKYKYIALFKILLKDEKFVNIIGREISKYFQFF